MIVLNSAYQVTQPGLLSATVSKTDVTCSGANDGTITISTPAGGYGTYEYSIKGFIMAFIGQLLPTSLTAPMISG